MDHYLTTTQLAERWSISAHTLRNWRRRGVGPAYFKPGGKKGHAYYHINDVKQHENENRQIPAQDRQQGSTKQ